MNKKSAIWFWIAATFLLFLAPTKFGVFDGEFSVLSSFLQPTNFSLPLLDPIIAIFALVIPLFFLFFLCTGIYFLLRWKKFDFVTVVSP